MGNFCVARARRFVAPMLGLWVICGVGEPVTAEVIQFIAPLAPVEQGAPFSVLVLLEENTTGLAGYSLEVDVAPELGAVGAVFGDVAATNFFPSRNLIERDPDDFINPFLSMIINPGDGGVGINALSNSLTAVNLAQPGYSDVLAEVVFNVAPGASGEFTISLGPTTALFDGTFGEVPFDAGSLTIQVVPEPGTWGMLVAAALVSKSRRRKR